MDVNRVGPASSYAPPATRPAAPAAGFGAALDSATQGLALTRHAQKRVERRDLNLDAGRLDRLNSAISRAAEKGARNSVVMLDDLAVVVDVPGRKVVTALNTEGGRQRVFTNIDSVVIA